jgi:hypothetical protein
VTCVPTDRLRLPAAPAQAQTEGVRKVGTVRIQRLSGGDLMQWQADVGPVPQNIAGLLHLGVADTTATALVGLIAQRLEGLALLSRRPVPAGFGCGSPVWLSDTAGAAAHVFREPLSHLDDSAVLAHAGALLVRPLPTDRAPWSVHVLCSEADVPVAVLVVLHHVLADGGTAVALVAALAAPDGGQVPHPVQHLPEVLPPRRVLAKDAWAAPLHAARRAPSLLRTLGPALHELGGQRMPLAARSVLNRRTGPNRRLALVTVPESALRAAARVYGGSLNDTVLVVIADVLADVAAQHDEVLDPVVVSVPVARRGRVSGAEQTGNAVGVMPTPVPTHGTLPERVASVAAWRHERLAGSSAGASLPIVLASFRVLHTLGLVGWFTDRQRLVTTFATSVAGPTEPIALAGIPVTAITPLVLSQGNTTVAFASLSYAGTLSLAVSADPDVGPDADAVADLLRARLTEAVDGIRPPTSAGSAPDG